MLPCPKLLVVLFIPSYFPFPKRVICFESKFVRGKSTAPINSFYSHMLAPYRNQCPTFKDRNIESRITVCNPMWCLYLTDHPNSSGEIQATVRYLVLFRTLSRLVSPALSEGFIRPPHDKSCYYLPSWNFCKIP